MTAPPARLVAGHVTRDGAGAGAGALLDLVRERHKVLLGADLPVNCDGCCHRVAPPGFEDEVGLPRHRHVHPADDGDHHHGHHHGHGHAHAHAH